MKNNILIILGFCVFMISFAFKSSSDVTTKSINEISTNLIDKDYKYDVSTDFVVIEGNYFLKISGKVEKNSTLENFHVLSTKEQFESNDVNSVFARLNKLNRGDICWSNNPFLTNCGESQVKAYECGERDPSGNCVPL